VIGRIVPEGAPKKRKPLPDFAAFRKEMFGSRVFPGADLVIEERGRY
jgi:hypothetical protein